MPGWAGKGAEQDGGGEGGTGHGVLCPTLVHPQGRGQGSKDARLPACRDAGGFSCSTPSPLASTERRAAGSGGPAHPNPQPLVTEQLHDSLSLGQNHLSLAQRACGWPAALVSQGKTAGAGGTVWLWDRSSTPGRWTQSGVRAWRSRSPSLQAALADKAEAACPDPHAACSDPRVWGSGTMAGADGRMNPSPAGCSCFPWHPEADLG